MERAVCFLLRRRAALFAGFGPGRLGSSSLWSDFSSIRGCFFFSGVVSVSSDIRRISQGLLRLLVGHVLAAGVRLAIVKY